MYPGSEADCNSLEDCIIVLKKDFLKKGCKEETMFALAPNPDDYYGFYLYYYNVERWPDLPQEAFR